VDSVKFGSMALDGLDLAEDCQSRGRGFKSRRARHLTQRYGAVASVTAFTLPHTLPSEYNAGFALPS